MDENNSTFREYKGAGYEVFILILSILSLVNLVFYVLPDFVPAATEVAAIIDLFISIIFIIDFLLRFFSYDSKSYYFFRNWGWADLLSSIPLPFAKIFRLFRIIRIIYVMKKSGLETIKEEVSKDRAEVALFFILISIIVVIELASILVVQFESLSPDANIDSGGDAIWWSFVTVSTVGYGDHYPVTTGGRIAGIILMISGVSIFGTLAGFLSSKLMPPKEEVSSSSPSGLDEIHSLLKDCRDIQDEIKNRLLDLENKITEKEEK